MRNNSRAKIHVIFKFHTFYLKHHFVLDIASNEDKRLISLKEKMYKNELVFSNVIKMLYTN